MPKIATNYTKTQIYKLKHKDDVDDENVYIGNTTDWINRKSAHKCGVCSELHKDYNLKKNQYIRENGGWEEWKMIWIENYPCNSKREAEAREEYWICELKAKLNTYKAHRTKEEAIEYQRIYDKNRIRDKEAENTRLLNYYHNNKGKILQKVSEKIICECGCLLRKDTLNRHRKSQKHIDIIKNIVL